MISVRRLLTIEVIFYGVGNMEDGQEDLQTLISVVLPIATQMLKEEKSFLPFGKVMKPNGEITHVNIPVDVEHTSIEAQIKFFLEAFHERAKTGKYRATAIVFNYREKLVSIDEDSDFIAVMLDHHTSFSLLVSFP